MELGTYVRRDPLQGGGISFEELEIKSGVENNKAAPYCGAAFIFGSEIPMLRLVHLMSTQTTSIFPLKSDEPQGD